MAGISLSRRSPTAGLARAAQLLREAASGWAPPLATTTPSEDSKDFYQERLALFHRVGFGISAAFLAGVLGSRSMLGMSMTDELQTPSRWCHIVATALMGVLWFALRRTRPRYRTLEIVDGIGTLVLSLLLNLNAGLFEIRAVSVYNLVLTTGVAVVLRSVIVPSSASRTLALGMAAAVCALTVFFVSALHPDWPVRQSVPEGWPLRLQLVSLVLWTGALVAIATVASRVIYGLRREVRAARMLGQYVLGDKIGEGGMGVVYRATHAMLRRETALKLLPPTRLDSAALRRFEREVRETARLRHPNTVAIFDYGRTLDGVFYYAMEYLDGISVDDLVDNEGPLPPGRVVHLLAQVCASLDEAHALGLVHRDIKPSNIMVVGHPGAFDLVKVLDFGLVKTITTDAPSMSTAGTIIGTPRYLAPEGIARPEEVDGRSDLYALAAVGYFMLTGTDVFEGGSVVEICAAHLYQEPLSIHERLGADVPKDLEALLLRCLSKNPDDRPSSAAELRALLLACEVPPWTQDEARGWWQAFDPRRSRSGERATNPEHAESVRVALAAR